MKSLFTASDVWAGGFFELALEIGARSDERLINALKSLWQFPALTGCYRDQTREPDAQPKFPPDESLVEGIHHYGYATLPNGSQVACGSCLIREVDDGQDWLDFYLPMGALSTAYPVGPYPFVDDLKPHEWWLREVEDWLSEIGTWVFHRASFRLGLIGFEVSGTHYSSEIVEMGVPSQRHIAYLWPSENLVTYYPRSNIPLST